MLCTLWNVFEVAHHVGVCVCVSLRVCAPATLCCLQDLIFQLLPGNVCLLFIFICVCVCVDENTVLGFIHMFMGVSFHF